MVGLVGGIAWLAQATEREIELRIGPGVDPELEFPDRINEEDRLTARAGLRSASEHTYDRQGGAPLHLEEHAEDPSDKDLCVRSE